MAVPAQGTGNKIILN